MLQCGMEVGGDRAEPRSQWHQIMPEELHIRLLGPLTLTRGGRALPDTIWRSRQERRLLGILLSARGRRVPTERLLEWLWPDADPGVAAITLRSAVSALRHTLEPAGGTRASSHYVLTKPGGYAWNTASGSWCDLDEFLTLTEEPKAEERGPKDDSAPEAVSALSAPTARAARLERAITLYRGDYLADDPDAAWANHLRESLRERLLASIHELAELRLAQGQPDAAIALARLGLEHDHLREPFYRTLMRAQTTAGDPAGALQSYERCRRALDDELGVTPSAQTRALHAAILRGELGELPPADKEPSKQADKLAMRPTSDEVAMSLQASNPPASVSPFVGRADELAALRGWIGALGQGRGGVVAVVGEAGIGKTRLVAEALRAAREQVFTIALRCTPLERGLPFASLSEALRPLLRAAPAELLRRLPPVALAQVADLLPVLRERLPDLPALASVPAGEARNYLLDGTVDVALALASERPLIAWCDDAQWADESTVAVIGRLARYAPRRPLLVVLSYRPEELVENASLHQLLRALGREMSLRPLVLGRLDQAAVADLLAGLAHATPADVAPLARRLSAASSGNPLVLAVAMQSLLEARGAGSLAALLPTLDERTPLPDLASAPPLRDLVLGRVERLSEPARALLDLLAVIGRPASLDLIEQIAGAPALEAAQALLERQFLAEGADQRLAFSHDLVRSIVLGALSLPQRRLLHRRAAEAIAALHGERPERAAELAFHFEQAGRGVEAELLRFATVAGDHARRSFGYHAAQAHYDAALQAAERLGQRAPAEPVRRVFVGRLLSAEALLDWDGVLATARRYDIWAAGRPGMPALVAPRRLAVLRALMGDLAGAAELGGDPRAQPEPLPALADLLQRTSQIFAPDLPGRSEHAQTPGSYAIPLVLAAPPPGTPAEELPAQLGADQAALALFQVGWAALMQGLLPAAEPCLQRAYDLAVDTGQAAVAVVGALQLAHLSALRGEQAAAERWLAISLDTARRAPEAAWASIWPQIHQAFLLLLDDQFIAARQRFEALAQQLRDLPAFQTHRASVEVGLALLDLAAGNLARAGARLTTALGAPQPLYGFVYAAAMHGLARLAALCGDIEAARGWLIRALGYSARRQLPPEYIRTAIEIARIERDFGEPARALALLERAAALAHEAGFGPLAAAAAALLARLTAAQP